MQTVEYRATQLTQQTNPSKITGTASVFNNAYQVYDRGNQPYLEIVRPGAFRSALEKQTDVIATYNHDPGELLGRRKSGTLKLWEDNQGLQFEIDINPESSRAKEIVSGIQRGDLDGASFAFPVQSVKDKWSNRDGTPVREILSLDLIDVAIVTMPANGQTSIELRSIVYTCDDWQWFVELHRKKLELANR